MELTALKLEKRCVGCGFCSTEITCPSLAECTGCGACVQACPYEARILVPRTSSRKVRIKIEGESFEVPERMTVLSALKLAGYSASSLPGEEIFAPCRTGGCWSCSVMVNGEQKPSCITPVREGMRISFEGTRPLRLVSGFQGHMVGGVGTPYWLKTGTGYIEAACFAHGCILRCPTCQNWEITYSSRGNPLSPREAAEIMTSTRRLYGVDRMAISGGEPTLNREWLIEYFRQLRRLNPDEKARIHLDTNAVLLTEDYIDELVEAGMTDIGIDVKGCYLETFMRITGIQDPELARKLHETEWRALKYALDRYGEELFIGVGIPYNEAFLSHEELAEIGERIASLDPQVQVCALDYRPEFRGRGIRRPSYQEMLEVKRILEDSGLKCVICQTERGHVGP